MSAIKYVKIKKNLNFDESEIDIEKKSICKNQKYVDNNTCIYSGSISEMTFQNSFYLDPDLSLEEKEKIEKLIKIRESKTYLN